MGIGKHRGGAQCAGNRATRINHKRNLLASRRTLFSFGQIVDPVQGVEGNRQCRGSAQRDQDRLPERIRRNTAVQKPAGVSLKAAFDARSCECAKGDQLTSVVIETS